MSVGLLSGEEFLDDLLHVGATGILSDSLERLLVLLLAVHLFLHLLFEVGAPEALDQQRLVHSQLI